MAPSPIATTARPTLAASTTLRKLRTRVKFLSHASFTHVSEATYSRRNFSERAVSSRSGSLFHILSDSHCSIACDRASFAGSTRLRHRPHGGALARQLTQPDHFGEQDLGAVHVAPCSLDRATVAPVLPALAPIPLGLSLLLGLLEQPLDASAPALVAPVATGRTHRLRRGLKDRDPGEHLGAPRTIVVVGRLASVSNNGHVSGEHPRAPVIRDSRAIGGDENARRRQRLDRETRRAAISDVSEPAAPDLDSWSRNSWSAPQRTALRSTKGATMTETSTTGTPTIDTTAVGGLDPNAIGTDFDGETEQDDPTDQRWNSDGAELRRSRIATVERTDSRESRNGRPTCSVAGRAASTSAPGASATSAAAPPCRCTPSAARGIGAMPTRVPAGRQPRRRWRSRSSITSSSASRPSTTTSAAASGGRAAAARDRRGSSRSRATGWARRGRRGCISRCTRIPRCTCRPVTDVLAGHSLRIEPVVVPGSTASLPLPPLRAGAAGARVAQLQEILAFWGYYQSRIDGSTVHAPLPPCRNGRRRWRRSTSVGRMASTGRVPTLPRPRRTPPWPRCERLREPVYRRTG